MRYTQYSRADEFLDRMGSYFEQTEALNGLMFGLCLQLKNDPFRYGEHQPLFAVVEEDGVIHLGALMTPPYKLQLCAPTSHSAQSIETLVRGLMANQWEVPAVVAEKHLAQSFACAWGTYQKCRHHEGQNLRIHELRHVQAITYAHGEFRQAKPQDIETVIAWARAFHHDCFGTDAPERSTRVTEQRVRNGELFFWRDPLPVSIAARNRPTPNGESIGLVYTPPEHRRQGYATSVVASLSQRLLDEGKQFCCLYTDLANPTSNSIYRKIGYVPVADVIDIHFDY
ncbi:MAG: GNAT family N-acetyltransferase [Anaerolineae bacterium]|nr:GNAT family N-acetyltransferase [Anaerolineae bacterium]